jgi:hypothetical protein
MLLKQTEVYVYCAGRYIKVDKQTGLTLILKFMTAHVVFSRTVNSVAPYIKNVSFRDLRSSGILRNVDC